MGSETRSPCENSKRGLLLLGVFFIAILSYGCILKAKVYHVGILSGVDFFSSIQDGFKEKMSELGYVEGKNIVYEFHKLNNDPAKDEQILKQLISNKVDLLFAFPTGPAIEAKSATKETKIPVIFCFSTIEDTGLVESVRHPGGNITGIRYPGPDLVVKRFEILREIEPKLRRLWLLYNPDYPAVKTSIEALRPAARSAGVALIETYIKNVDDIRAAVAAREKLADIGIDAILILPEIISQSFEGWKVINDFASEHKLAIGGNAGEQADRGALFSYMPDNIENGRLAASLADKILKGTPAGTIPVITPESRLRLNYRKIKELGLKVSEGLLSQASDIIR